MKVLYKLECSNVFGGTPSGRRCDRLRRREDRNALNGNDVVADRVRSTWDRICKGKGANGGNIGSY